MDVDIKGFFDNIPHKLILESIAAKISDGNILNLIERFLNSGVMGKGELKPTITATPQGGVISPLLANIALDHLDWYLEAKGYLFVRYADDFIVLCKSRPEAERVLDDIKIFLDKSVFRLLLREIVRVSIRTLYRFQRDCCKSVSPDCLGIDVWPKQILWVSYYLFLLRGNCLARRQSRSHVPYCSKSIKGQELPHL